MIFFFTLVIQSGSETIKTDLLQATFWYFVPFRLEDSRVVWKIPLNYAEYSLFAPIPLISWHMSLIDHCMVLLYFNWLCCQFSPNNSSCEQNLETIKTNQRKSLILPRADWINICGRLVGGRVKIFYAVN